MWVWGLLPLSILVAAAIGAGVQRGVNRQRARRLREAARDHGFTEPLELSSAPTWSFLVRMNDLECRLSQLIAGRLGETDAWLAELRHRRGVFALLVRHVAATDGIDGPVVANPTDAPSLWPGEETLVREAEEPLREQLDDGMPMFLCRVDAEVTVGIAGALTPTAVAELCVRAEVLSFPASRE